MKKLTEWKLDDQIKTRKDLVNFMWAAVDDVIKIQRLRKKELKDALETIVELTDGSQEYNASQFKWAQIYAQDALDKIAK